METKSRSAPKIILVDDERLVLDYVQILLEAAGYTVLAADSPEAALKLSLKAGHVDLLVTDVAMPHMNGPQLYERLRESRPGLKVLFMSGYPDAAKSLCNLSDNSVRFVEKPVTSEALLKKVAAVLGQ
jgi:DNA-binding NtrC family response regulator